MKRRAERIEHFKAHPVEVQHQIFHELIEAARYTDWGRKYRYDTIQTIKQYQERVY